MTPLQELRLAVANVATATCHTQSVQHPVGIVISNNEVLTNCFSTIYP